MNANHINQNSRWLQRQLGSQDILHSEISEMCRLREMYERDPESLRNDTPRQNEGMDGVTKGQMW